MRHDVDVMAFAQPSIFQDIKKTDLKKKKEEKNTSISISIFRFITPAASTTFPGSLL